MSSSNRPHGRRPRRQNRSTLRTATAAALLLACLGPGTAAATTPPTSGRAALPHGFTAGRYVITFAGAPAATYTGGVPGLSRTAPAHRSRLAADSAPVRAYVNHLRQTKRAVLKRAGIANFTDYSMVLNGAAADLTAQQAKTLAADPAVVSLAKDRKETVQTNRSPQFLNVPALWKAAGGRDRAGSGVVVGVLDTGIWPESASFRPNHTPVPASFAGTCQTGQEWTPGDCNDKIVGARYYVDGFGQDHLSDDEYLSPRDGDSHGSHTASTAAGDRVNDVTVDGVHQGTLSGMAPGAKVAAYKVCWSGKPGVAADGCMSSDIIAAVNDAVSDGVDVINFSIGGTSESAVNDPQEAAFLDAAAAGVFVSASAGNSGPGASTLDHPSPWVTTVAASTFKTASAVLLLGDGRRFVGASSTAPLPRQTPLVLASRAEASGRDGAHCQAGSLDPAKVAGKLVVCLRGVNDRAEKSWVVQQAGGVGMVLVNPTVNSLNADLHHVPSVHLPNTAYGPVTAYAATAGATGAIVPLEAGEKGPAVPQVAEFSSRGPSTTTHGDLLKPDLAAPGVDVLAAVSPEANHGRDYDMLSGTSMAAPHVAGLAALLKAAHRDWTPMMIKSALMTTARDMAGDTGPFTQGAGNVRPDLATDPGLVFNSGVRNWVSFLKGQGMLPMSSYTTVAPTTASNLNLASVAVGALPGTTRLSRTLTSVSRRTETYTFSARVPGFAVTASPGEVTLRPGQSRTVSLLLRRTTATPGAWATGTAGFRSAYHRVRMPVALRPVAAMVEPTAVTGSGPTGHATLTVRSGVDGPVTTTVSGLTGAPARHGTVDSSETGDDSVDSTPWSVNVPDDTGTAAVRFDVAATDAGDDLDLYVYRVHDGAATLVGTSATASGRESVTVQNPGKGEYRAVVVGFRVGGEGNYTMHQWAVPRGDARNLSVTPAWFTGRQGGSRHLDLSWSGLAADQAYFGVVDVAAGGRSGGRCTVYVAGR